ncbi:hypothetical protein [Variovorax soli]|mgnify:CR=1 FL=1|jgi:hypothetical protein|uniref:hypothetical protein n=1 Tax=Variovorax soli TaxID=376815 RepID=UPI000838C228|nr:hypothetical protein [Variovorax soli]
MNERRIIQRVGFRKWYERELLQCHGHLVLLLLCFVGLLGGIELLGSHGSLQVRLAALACVVASAIVGHRALRRYLLMLGHAQHMAEQASCPVCGTYARWDIEDEQAQEGAPQSRLHVRCRHCASTWNIAL